MGGRVGGFLSKSRTLILQHFMVVLPVWPRFPNVYLEETGGDLLLPFGHLNGVNFRNSGLDLSSGKVGESISLQDSELSAMREHSSWFDLEIETDGARTSVRFPLHLPVRIMSEDREFAGMTENISANGVLFRLKERLPINAPVEFLLEISAGELCGENTAAVHCLGRVVRSYEEHSSCFAAAVIDEYRFQ